MQTMYASRIMVPRVKQLQQINFSKRFLTTLRLNCQYNYTCRMQQRHRQSANGAWPSTSTPVWTVVDEPLAIAMLLSDSQCNSF